MSRKINRRAILVGTAAVVPAAAVASIPALAGPSGELSFPDLADQFARLYPRWSGANWPVSLIPVRSEGPISNS